MAAGAAAYNDLGRYFDAATGVVYHEHNVLVWACTALVLALLGIASLLAAKT